MQYRPPRTRHAAGFSLIELVIVVVIIGIIGAIAIPRLSRGSAGANASKLKQDLVVLNKAIDLYAAEHGGTFPDKDNIVAQLTQFSDMEGNTEARKDVNHYLGPYLRRIPPAPGGANPGATGISHKHTGGIGWLYNETRGLIRLNRGGTGDITVEDEALGRARDLVNGL